MRSTTNGPGVPLAWLAVRPASPRGVGQCASAGDQVPGPASYVYTLVSANEVPEASGVSDAPAASSLAPSPSSSASVATSPAPPGLGKLASTCALSSSAMSPPIRKNTTPGPCAAATGPASRGPCAGEGIVFGQPGRAVNGAPSASRTSIALGVEGATRISSTPSPLRSASAGSCAIWPARLTLKPGEPSAATAASCPGEATTTLGGVPGPPSRATTGANGALNGPAG